MISVTIVPSNKPEPDTTIPGIILEFSTVNTVEKEPGVTGLNEIT